MIWFRSANSHRGPQLHRCIRGRTDGSIRLCANLLQKPLALGGASTTDEYIRLAGGKYDDRRGVLPDHRNAVLVFPPPAQPGPVQIVVKDVGGVAERSFSWELPPPR